MKEHQEQSQHPLILDKIASSPSSSSNNINDNNSKGGGDGSSLISCGGVVNINRKRRKKKKREKKEDDEEDEGEEYPIGYKFFPCDDELIIYYLKNKIFNRPLPHNKIQSVNLYHYNPDHLAAKYKPLGENQWYFFTPRDKKYRNGSRPNRAAGTGYWKATGVDKRITNSGEIVGNRKALVFYQGRPPKGQKTNWIMHEYRVSNPPVRTRKDANDMRLDDWVLCKIHKKTGKGKAEEGKAKEAPPLVGSHKVMNEDDHHHEHHLELMSVDSNGTTQDLKMCALVENPNMINNYNYVNNDTVVQLPPFPPSQDYSQNYSNFAYHPYLPPQQFAMRPLSYDIFNQSTLKSMYPQTQGVLLGGFGICQEEFVFQNQEDEFDIESSSLDTCMNNYNSIFSNDILHTNAPYNTQQGNTQQGYTTAGSCTQHTSTQHASSKR